jgi:hypothetical protein
MKNFIALQEQKLAKQKTYKWKWIDHTLMMDNIALTWQAEGKKKLEG